MSFARAKAGEAPFKQRRTRILSFNTRWVALLSRGTFPFSFSPNGDKKIPGLMLRDWDDLARIALGDLR
jgi:hypothetical protein